MFLFEERRLSFIVSLVQSVELTVWGDMNIFILFGKITVYFWLKSIHFSFKELLFNEPFNPCSVNRTLLQAHWSIKGQGYCRTCLQP